jgi:hypothetical protein
MKISELIFETPSTPVDPQNGDQPELIKDQIIAELEAAHNWGLLFCFTKL